MELYPPHPSNKKRIESMFSNFFDDTIDTGPRKYTFDEVLKGILEGKRYKLRHWDHDSWENDFVYGSLVCLRVSGLPITIYQMLSHQWIEVENE